VRARHSRCRCRARLACPGRRKGCAAGSRRARQAPLPGGIAMSAREGSMWIGSRWLGAQIGKVQGGAPDRTVIFSSSSTRSEQYLPLGVRLTRTLHPLQLYEAEGGGGAQRLQRARCPLRLCPPPPSDICHGVADSAGRSSARSAQRRQAPPRGRSHSHFADCVSRMK